MPIVNVRNSQAKSLQGTDFTKKQSHFTGVSNLVTLSKSAPAVIDSWILSAISRSAANYPYYPSIVDPMYWTGTVNACAQLANPANTILRHGLIGAANLGEVNLYALYALAALNNSRTFVEGWSTTQGLWTMVGLWLPATSTPPAAGPTSVKTIFAKWKIDTNAANYLFSWRLIWEIFGGVSGVNAGFSETGGAGTGAAAWFRTSMNMTPGNFYIVGFILNPSTNVTVFVNDQYQTFVAPTSVSGGHPNRVPITIFQGTNCPVTIARLETQTVGAPSYASADAYYYFANYGHAALTIDQWLAMYYLVKPALGWNTNLGGV